ncbi:cell envelope biogenesis protein OmpA [Adhaeribacter aerolatus]|uniref:Cell envelope biogenesis protein OmpA n=1 Tax=Adhaeribacter aerolatus TaxID=670289 RepID=A0A512AYE3_9BACT|nr:OmpA family protein [Adhaeribacter aerolatus]GEO04728.1 cell envelope biogenesis protein OmpA [Adhaeribacter aerolatus]
MYQKADEYVRARNFPKAIEALNDAKEKDTAFGEAYLKLAGMYKVLGDRKNSYENYKYALRLIPYNPKLMQEYYAFADLSLSLGQYRLAKTNFEKFLQASPQGTKASNYANAQLKNISFAETAMRNPVSFAPQRLTSPFNTFALQYFPALTANQQHLLFTARMGNKPENDENLFVSARREEGWTEPVSISPNINTRYNEGTGSISGDGKTLVFASCDRPDSFGNCDLYISYRTGEKWSKPVNLGNTVNGTGWDSQPCLSADGRTLYFSSIRSGGQGREDIWVTTLQDDEKWSKPVNLGPNINSPGNENSPFIHSSGSTLYFASDGQIGLGGTDIFKVTTDATGNWLEPQNLGYPLNTFENENSIFITTDNRTGYYSRQQTNHQGPNTIELYQFEVPTAWKSREESTIAQGRVFDAKTKKPLGATVQLYDVTTDKLVQQVKSDVVSGDYTAVLTEGKHYALYVSASNYLLKSLSFDYIGKKDFNPVTLDVYLEPITSGAAIVLNNLFFPTGKHSLESKSKTELNKLIQFLVQNKGVKIEISGHTDNVGEQAANLTLSKKRAQSVVDYLSQHGISRDRIVAAGYGEGKPVAKNDSEENRQLNRRIELKII